MRIVGLGNALTDVLARLHSDSCFEEMGLLKGGMQLIDEEKLLKIMSIFEELETTLASGGSAANAVSGVTRMGVSGGFIGKIGRDAYGRFFREEQIGPIERQVAVYFVGRDLMKAFYAEFAAGVHQNLRAEDIRFQKDGRIFDAAIDMAFRRKVHDHVGFFLFEQRFHRLLIGDVRFDEAELRVAHDGAQSGKIAGISQAIEAHHAVVGIFVQIIKDKIASDEACAARYHDISLEFHVYQRIVIWFRLS